MPFVFALLGLIDMRLRDAPAQQNYRNVHDHWSEHRWPFATTSEVIWGDPNIRVSRYYTGPRPQRVWGMPPFETRREPGAKSLKIGLGWPYPVFFGSVYQPLEIDWPLGDSSGRPQHVYETTFVEEGFLLSDTRFDERSVLPTPRWGALGSQAALFGAIIVGPQLLIMGFVRIKRRRKDQCRRCGYPISEPICPECGAETGKAIAEAVNA